MKSTTTLILASKSPRRIELMTLAGFDFLSVPAVKEEKITGGTSPSDAVLMLSRQKAEEIAEKYPYNTVIGADTVVALGNEIMGKPENEQAPVRPGCSSAGTPVPAGSPPVSA